MNKCILDASALLALINDEPGAEMVQKVLSHSLMSSVNASEVISLLYYELNIDPDEGQEMVHTLVSEVVSFTLDMAKKTAGLRKKTALLGLSLGDRACIALGLDLSLPVYTADRIWKKHHLGCDIVLIR